MSYRYKSGAFKRKEKRLKEEQQKRGQKSLFSTGFVKDSNSATTSSVPADESSNSSVPASDVSVEESVDEEQLEDAVEERLIHHSNAVSLNQSSMQSGTSSVTQTSVDQITLTEIEISQAEIEQLVRNGPPKHPAVFPKDIANCSFPASLLQTMKL
jgi:hypothetical protein